MENLDKKIKEIPIVCPNFACGERGRIDRCYLGIYKDCARYKAHRIIVQAEESEKKRRYT